MKSVYAAQIHSLLLRKSWLVPAFLLLSIEDAGRLIKALCAFWTGEDVDLEGEQLANIFSIIARASEDSARRGLERTKTDEKERTV